MRVKFSFDYGTTLEGFEITQLAEAGVDVEHDDGVVKSYVTYEGELERVLAIIGQRNRVTLHGMGEPQPLADVVNELREMRTRLTDATAKPEAYVNNKVDVHVPGNALLAIDDVCLREDCCTDALGDLLADGWRIVAVCPQPDQRRPDYVLGRRRAEA